jgi:hypothetical protein
MNQTSGAVSQSCILRDATAPIGDSRSISQRSTDQRPASIYNGRMGSEPVRTGNRRCLHSDGAISRSSWLAYHRRLYERSPAIWPHSAAVIPRSQWLAYISSRYGCTQGCDVSYIYLSNRYGCSHGCAVSCIYLSSMGPEPVRTGNRRCSHSTGVISRSPRLAYPGSSNGFKRVKNCASGLWIR